VDRATGTVTFAVNLGWHHLPLGERLAATLGVPVDVENDVRTAAAGLHRRAPFGQIDDLAYLSIGTGISAGIVLGGRVHRGVRGVAGEIGHIVLEPGGPLCACGLDGCFEALAAGSAIARAARDAIAAHKQELVRTRSSIEAHQSKLERARGKREDALAKIKAKEQKLDGDVADLQAKIASQLAGPSIALAAGLGILVSCTVLEVAGAALATVAGTSWGPNDVPTDQFVKPLPDALGLVATVAIAVGAIAANVLNLYSAAMSFLTLGIRLTLRRRRAIVAKFAADIDELYA